MSFPSYIEIRSIFVTFFVSGIFSHFFVSGIFNYQLYWPMNNHITVSLLLTFFSLLLLFHVANSFIPVSWHPSSLKFLCKREREREREREISTREEERGGRGRKKQMIRGRECQFIFNVMFYFSSNLVPILQLGIVREEEVSERLNARVFLLPH